MLTLYHDAVQKISSFLLDREKINLTMTSKSMNALKYKFIYHEKIIIAKIEIYHILIISSALKY